MKKRRWFSSVPAVGLAVVMLGSVALISSARLAKADAPLCRYLITMNTVVDNETNLTWQRANDNLAYTWDEAKTHCAMLTLEGSAWRLPTVHELQSIVDESKANPAIDQAVFPVHAANVFLVVSGLRWPPGRRMGHRFCRRQRHTQRRGRRGPRSLCSLRRSTKLAGGYWPCQPCPLLGM